MNEVSRRTVVLAGAAAGLGLAVSGLAGRGALGQGAPAIGAAPAANAAQEPNRLKVAFMGDSMADGFWGAFFRYLTREKCLKDRMDAGRFAKNGTGLTRTDSFDWPIQARKIVETYGPGAVVASIGINDRQDVVEASHSRATYGTPAWDDSYRARIVQFLQAAAAQNATVVLVGLPAMREAVVNADAQAKNRLFAEAVKAAAKPNIQYIEPWQAANAAPGVFSSAAPGEGGRGLVQVRAPDGIHFTAQGYDILMAYLYPKLIAALGEAGRELKSACSGS